jgi:hypothetical protein
MNNIIKFESQKKSLLKIEHDNEIDNTEKYKDIYHTIHRISDIISTLSITSKALYYEDYKDKNDMYIVLNSMLKVLSHIMEDCEFKISDLLFSVDHKTYEEISNQSEKWLEMIDTKKSSNCNTPLQFKIRSTRGEEITI